MPRDESPIILRLHTFDVYTVVFLHLMAHAKLTFYMQPANTRAHKQGKAREWEYRATIPGFVKRLNGKARMEKPRGNIYSEFSSKIKSRGSFIMRCLAINLLYLITDVVYIIFLPTFL